MDKDKLLQYFGLFGGLLSAILLFLGTLNIEFGWLTEDSINGFVAVLIAGIPFLVLLYGVWGNSYIITRKAKRQEALLKQRGMK